MWFGGGVGRNRPGGFWFSVDCLADLRVSSGGVGGRPRKFELLWLAGVTVGIPRDQFCLELGQIELAVVGAPAAVERK